MKQRAIYVGLGLILIAAVGGVIFWRSVWAEDPQEPPARSTLVERGSMIVAVSATGRIQSAARVGLTFEAPGRVAEIWAEEGERVSSGQPLAQLAADELELQVEQSSAGLAAAEVFDPQAAALAFGFARAQVVPAGPGVE